MNVVRTRSWILREYNREKYARVLSQNPATPEEAWRLLLNNDALWQQEKLTALVIDGLLHRYGRNRRIVELGCGCGYHVARHPNAIGGELTENGRAVAARFQLPVFPFDYLESGDYARLIPADACIFTSASIEQLHSVRVFLNNLRTVRDRVAWVVHLEPGIVTPRKRPEHNDYIRVNDYCRDFFEIEKQDDVEVDLKIVDAVGQDGHHPRHVLVWRFKPSF